MTILYLITKREGTIGFRTCGLSIVVILFNQEVLQF